MSVRTIALATALSLGLGSAAMAQAIIIEPGTPYYDAPTYEPAPWGPTYRRGDRYDENFGSRSYDPGYNDGYSNWGWRGKMRQDQYNDETGINNN